MSVPHSNSMVTTLIPTPVLERTRRTPPAPFIAVSIGKVTSRSTSSGGMPCASATTVTEGAVRSGKTSTGACRELQPPQNSSNRAAASTSRRLPSDQRMMRSIMASGSSVRVSVPHFLAAGGRELHEIGTLGYHALARRHAAHDLDQAAVVNAEPYRPAHEGVAAGLHVDHIETTVVDHRAARDGQPGHGCVDKNMCGEACPHRGGPLCCRVLHRDARGAGCGVDRCCDLHHVSPLRFIQHDGGADLALEPGA